jgi:chromosome segregation ATPase
MTDGAVDVPDNSNHPATHILALTKRINKLLERVAKQEADNTKLQREKTTAKEANRDLHSRLSQITQALGALNVSYAKRLEEKNVVVHENTSIEQHNTSLREELTGYLRQVCELEIKVQIMEGEAEEAKAEKEGLQKRVTEVS